MGKFIEWFFIKKIKMYTPVLWLWITFACIVAINADKIPFIFDNFTVVALTYVAITLMLLKLEKTTSK